MFVEFSLSKGVSLKINFAGGEFSYIYYYTLASKDSVYFYKIPKVDDLKFNQTVVPMTLQMFIQSLWSRVYASVKKILHTNQKV